MGDVRYFGLSAEKLIERYGLVDAERDAKKQLRLQMNLHIDIMDYIRRKNFIKKRA